MSCLNWLGSQQEMNAQPDRAASTEARVEDSEVPTPKLNLFVMPSLTTLLFSLIAGVILVAIAAGLRQNPSFLGFLIAIGMILLPLRDFLRRVETDLRLLGVWPVPAQPPPLTLVQEVDETARDLQLGDPPRLLMVAHEQRPAIIGSWRRRYLVLGRPQAERLTNLPSATRRTLWLHELGHFANGDNWKVGLARSLLRTCIVFMTWSAFFLLGAVILARVYGMELLEPGYLDTLPLDPTLRNLLAPIWPDAAVTAPLLEKARSTDLSMAALYVLYAHLPFVLSGAVLLPLVWRRLVRVREFYADARVAALARDVTTTKRTLQDVALEIAPLTGQKPGRIPNWWAALRRQAMPASSFHPLWPARFACLDDPAKVFGSSSWAGLTAGFTVLLLDLILVGPFTLGYLSGGPAHFVTIAGFLILAMWLLPGVCRGFPSTGRMAREVFRASLLFAALRAGWLLLNTGLLLILLALTPQTVQDLLNAIVYLGHKVLTTPAGLFPTQSPSMLVLSSVGGAWILTVLILACLLGSLLLTGALLRRVLTWYSFPNAERRLIRVCLGLVLLVALVLGLVVLPLPTALTIGDPSSLLRPAPLAAGGATLLLAAVGVVWFVWTDRRYGGRCPFCSSSEVPRQFELGKQCPKCGELLHPWLVANY